MVFTTGILALEYLVLIKHSMQGYRPTGVLEIRSRDRVLHRFKRAYNGGRELQAECRAVPTQRGTA
eukprot:1421013-Rhodomonas_salina.1